VTTAIYFDLFAGCSGDMILGALLDAGLELEQLADGLAALPVAGYRISQKKVKRGTVAATMAEVSMDDSNHRQDRSYHDIAQLISTSTHSNTVKIHATNIFRNLG
jgi:uncharacterized protein (DUF111 family)